MKNKKYTFLFFIYLSLKYIYLFYIYIIQVGLKPAGGIKVPQEALEWMMLVQMELGEEWLCKDLFRIGSSNLLDNIIEEIQ